MRYLVKRIPSTSLVQYDGSRYYCEIAGGTAEKSTVDTTGLLAGSKYLDVQTGTWYVYDELTNAWAVSAEGGSADPAVVEAAVEAWLDAHPEATTTVQDGSISYAKLDTTLKGKADAVTQLSDEIDGIDSDVTDLKSAFDNDLTMPLAGHSIIQGSYNSSGEVVANPARIRVSGFIEVKKGEIIKFTAGANTTGMLVGLFNTDKVYQSESWYPDGASVNILSDGYIILVFRKDTSNTAITPTEYDATTQITPVIWGEIEKNRVNLVDLKSVVNQAIVVVPIEKDISSEITWESGYYTLAGSYNSSTVLRHTQKIAVNAGDVFTHGGNETINFRYITAYNGDIAVSASGAESSYHYVVPNSITGIIISDYVSRGDIEIYHITSTTENVLIPRLKSIYQGNYLSKFNTSDSAKFTNLSVGDVLDLSPLNNAGQHKTLLIDDVAEGESFYINTTDGTESKPWAFLDGDNKILSMADTAEAIGMTIVAPSGAKKLLLQVGSVHFANAVCIRYSSFDYYDKSTDIKKLNEYTEYKNKLENASNVYGNDTANPVKSRANLLNLIHFSDVHGNVTNIERLLEFNDIYSNYITDIIHTGDSVKTYFSNENPFATIGGAKVLNVIGNHECWIQGDTWPSPYNATAQQVYEKFIAPYISSWGVVSAGTNLCYYYKDYSTAKVRLIVLDALHYDLTQETWFANTLENARTENLRVVAVTHYPAQTGLNGIDCTFNSITRTINAVSTPPEGTQIERMPESAFTTVDTFINNGGEFVCWLSGHTHEDFIGVVNNHENQLQIIISCADTSNKYSDCARTKNTKTQDLFNVFTVDTNSKLIKLIRVGSTMDKFMRHRETLCINYNSKSVIANN